MEEKASHHFVNQSEWQSVYICNGQMKVVNTGRVRGREMVVVTIRVDSVKAVKIMNWC